MCVEPRRKPTIYFPPTFTRRGVRGAVEEGGKGAVEERGIILKKSEKNTIFTIKKD
ncbi:hypothetical protein MASR1M107_07670 [Ignavibacteriales bacterium]